MGKENDHDASKPEIGIIVSDHWLH